MAIEIWYRKVSRVLVYQILLSNKGTGIKTTDGPDEVLNTKYLIFSLC